MGKTLEPVTATGLGRTTVHQQYNGKAFGLYMFGRLVPFVLTVRRPGNQYEKVVVMFGAPAHTHSPYRDLGLKRVCCRQVFAFNVRHYVKCYLPNAVAKNGRILTPYTFNLCENCGATMTDDCGHFISMTKSREYRRNAYIWKAAKVLQDHQGADEIFTHQRGVAGNGC